MSDVHRVLLKAQRLLDGSGGPPVEKAALLIEDSRIMAVGRQEDVNVAGGADVAEFDYGDATILPGLVDAHTHLVAPGNGTPGDDLAQAGDDVLLMQAARNARAALLAGVTTLRDNGAKNRVAFSLRECVERGLTAAPRLNLCGRPITITGGHMWYFGAEADGEDGVRIEVRKLIKEGADYIKIVATGGSTRSSYRFLPAFTIEELKAITDEARKFRKLTAAHCACSQGISDCLDAGVDMIIHCEFRDPDGRYLFNKDLAERIIEADAWVNPTIHIAKSGIIKLEEERGLKGTLTKEEEQKLDDRKKQLENQLETTRRLLEMGAKVIAGSDSPWMDYTPGGFAHEIQAMADAGMTNGEAIVAGTSDAAKAIGLGSEAGSLIAGAPADVFVVNGDPLTDLKALWNVRDIYKDGLRVRREAM